MTETLFKQEDAITIAKKRNTTRSFQAITLLIVGKDILLSGMSFLLADFEFQRDMENRTHEVNSQT